MDIRKTEAYALNQRAVALAKQAWKLAESRGEDPSAAYALAVDDAEAGHEPPDFWQPIDGAPLEEDRRILLWVPYHGKGAEICVGYWRLDCWRWFHRGAPALARLAYSTRSGSRSRMRGRNSPRSTKRN